MLFFLLGSKIISPQPSSDTVVISLVMVVFKTDVYIIYFLIWLHGVLLAACRIFRCSMHILSCGIERWLLVPQSRMEPGPPALRVWSFSHWTTGEALLMVISLYCRLI